MLSDTDIPMTEEDIALRHIQSISWQREKNDVVKTGDAYGSDTIAALATVGVPPEAIICDTKRKPSLLRVEGEEACTVMARLGIVPSYWQGRAKASTLTSVASR